VRVNRRLFSLRNEQMFGAIAGVLKDESEAFSNQLSELAAHIQASLAELAKMAARFDTEGDWGAGGYRSCADFLSVRAGLNLRTGSELLRVGHAMERLPKLAEVFSAGEISFDKARAVASVATPADEHMWVELARQASTGPFSRWVLEYRRAAEADSPDRADAHAARRGVWSRWEDDGMLRLVAKLPPEEGAVVLAAIEAVCGQRPSVDEKADDRFAAGKADALVAVCEHALATVPEDLVVAPASRHLVVHVDVGVLTGVEPEGRCQLDGGPALSKATALRLGCDCNVTAVSEREGLPIDVGRTTRVISPRLRMALNCRDRGCRFPGCGVPARRTEGHHIRHWALGGPTDLANLLSLCWFHHRRHHHGHFRVLGTGAKARFETADGELIAVSVPKRVDRVTGGPAHLRKLSADRGLTIDHDTVAAKDSEPRTDVHYIVDTMMDACARANAGLDDGFRLP